MPDSRRGVLFVSTATRSPLGADSWIHLQIMRAIDRDSVAPHLACVRDRKGVATPTYAAASEIPDLPIVDVDFGGGVSRRSRLRTAWDAATSAVCICAGLVRLRSYVRRRGITVIHTTDRPRDAVACVALARLTGATCVIHVHVAYGTWMSKALRWALRRADALIAVSEFVASTLVDAGHDASRVHVVLNAIDPNAWEPGVDRERTRRELGVADGRPLVLSVSRLFREKGTAELIKACADVRHDVADLRLVIAGEDVTGGSFKAELDALVAELELGDVVTFIGYRHDVARLFAAADVFAMPSFDEPFGLVFLEAMAMEVPVVALDNAGTREVVDNGRSGLLSAPGDHPALVANLSALLADPARRRTMGADGRGGVIERFGLERMAADTAAVYGRVDHARARRARRRAAPTAARVATTRVTPTDIDECRKRLDEDGFVVFSGVVSPERLATLGTALAEEHDRLSGRGELFTGGGSLTGHLNCFPGAQSQFVYDDLERAGVIDVVRAVRPDIIGRPRATMNFNRPGSVAQHYHTDGLYTEEFLICNVAVVDTDLVNGALDVLPGTHRRFYKFWQYALQRLNRSTTRVTMHQGDAVLRKSTVWHRGMPNMSAAARPMMAITFGESGAPDGDPFALNDGQPFFFPNWYNTSRLGQLRERTFVAAPLTYSAYRFARSLYGNKGYSSF